MKKLLLVAVLSTLTACGSEDVFGEAEEESKLDVVSAISFTERANTETSPLYDFDATYTEDGAKVTREDLHWNWSVSLPGEGEIATLYPEEEPQYQFTEAATYQVTVSVSEPSGKKLAQFSKNIIIDAEDLATPVLLPNPVIDLISKNLLTVKLDARNSNYSGGSISNFEWVIDGKKFYTQDPSHQFTQAGTHTVYLKVISNDEIENSITKEITVASEPTIPTADFFYRTESLNISFNAELSDNDSSGIAAYDWDFGNGDSATGMQVSTSYPAQADYTVTLTVTSQEGEIDTITKTISVKENASYITCDILTSSHTIYRSRDEGQCFTSIANGPFASKADATEWCNAQIQKYEDQMSRLFTTNLTWEVRQTGNNQCTEQNEL